MASTLTKLEVVNNALNSIGERSQSAIGGILGNMISSSLRESIMYVCNQMQWKELLSIVNAASWSSNQATLPDRTYRVLDMYWYTSPDGLPESTYDYEKQSIAYTSIEEFQSEQLYPFTDNAARPLVWSKLTEDVVVCNPYPNNTLSRAKCFFSVYRYPEVPVADTDNFSTSDLLTNLFQYKLAELLAIKHIGDLNMASALNKLYMDFYKANQISTSGTPSYTMYRGHRR